jgi:hypothetical protein
MARRYASFEVEQIKQLALIARLSTHHGKPPPPNHLADGITVRQKSRALFQQYRSFTSVWRCRRRVRSSLDSRHLLALQQVA